MQLLILLKSLITLSFFFFFFFCSFLSIFCFFLSRNSSNFFELPHFFFLYFFLFSSFSFLYPPLITLIFSICAFSYKTLFLFLTSVSFAFFTDPNNFFFNFYFIIQMSHNLIFEVTISFLLLLFHIFLNSFSSFFLSVYFTFISICFPFSYHFLSFAFFFPCFYEIYLREYNSPPTTNLK